MATVATDIGAPGAAWDRKRVAQVMLALAIAFAIAKPWLPAVLVRIPEAWVLPWDIWMQAIFDFIRTDLGLEILTRWIAEGPLQFLLDMTANLLEGKRRWPFVGPIPWTAIAAAAAVLGYFLGGWKMALLAGGTFVWTALVGQWKLAMQTMSVIVVAAPVAFFAGLVLGILAWKYRAFERAILPVLAVLQTLPFFTYLLPAVIFFKVGPTAGAVATIIYAIPPMVLMTSLGLKKVSPEVIEDLGPRGWQVYMAEHLPARRAGHLASLDHLG